MSYDITHMDILRWCKEYDGPLYHAALMDAPYEEEFMGKGWDNTGIAFNPETWKAIARCLHPGAFLFVFAGTLNDDLISVAMRNAGLRKYHRGAAWCYGSGFPKATQISPQVDRAAGAERQVISTRKHAPKFDAAGHGYRKKDNGYNSKDRQSFDVTESATELAQAWDGHRYGGQMLKPALEPILIFQKPYQGKPIDCITRTGAGAINIDGGRISTNEIVNEQYEAYKGSAGIYNEYGSTLRHNGSGTSHELGRWPANLILSHHPECNGHCVELCPVRRLGEQSGKTLSGNASGQYGTYEHGTDGVTWKLNNKTPNREPVGDSGTAARYFYNVDWMAERLEDSDPVIYQAKASTAEREAGLDPRTTNQQFVPESADPGALRDGGRGSHPGRIDRTQFAQDVIDDGREKSIDNPYQRGETMRRNIHPTIKPISLARHLATLLLPPDMYSPRRLLVPFAGAGSEMIGAMFAGWEDVQGVELEADHVAIAEARLAFWQQMKYKLMNPDTPVKVSINRVPDGQMDMFEED